jgi:hypothetical protein
MRSRRGLRRQLTALDAENEQLHATVARLTRELDAARLDARHLRHALAELGRRLHQAQDGDTVPLRAVDTGDELLVPWGHA